MQIRRNESRGSGRLPRLLATVMACVLAVGMSVAWTPHFWGSAIVYACVLLTAGAWIIGTKTFVAIPFSAALPTALLAVWGWLQLALLGTAAPWQTIVHSLGWTVAVIAFHLSLQTLHSSAARGRFLSVLAWLCAAFALQALLQLYSSPDRALWLFPVVAVQPVGAFLYKNQFAAMIELAMPIALYWMLFKRERRAEGICVFLALVAGTVTSGSRAGAALVLAECVVAVLLAWRRKKLSPMFLLGLPAALGLLVATAYVAGNDLLWSHFQELHTDIIRQRLLQSTLRMYRSEPWSGFGLGTWSIIYPPYATFDVGRLANAAHNDWAEWAAEGGLVFAGSMLALFVRILKPALDSVWGLGVIAVMLHSWVDYPLREPSVCVFWFFLAGALCAVRQETSEKKEAAAH